MQISLITTSIAFIGLLIVSLWNLEERCMSLMRLIQVDKKKFEEDIEQVLHSSLSTYVPPFKCILSEKLKVCSLTGQNKLPAYSKSISPFEHCTGTLTQTPQQYPLAPRLPMLCTNPDIQESVLSRENIQFTTALTSTRDINIFVLGSFLSTAPITISSQLQIFSGGSVEIDQLELTPEGRVYIKAFGTIKITRLKNQGSLILSDLYGTREFGSAQYPERSFTYIQKIPWGIVEQ